MYKHAAAVILLIHLLIPPATWCEAQPQRPSEYEVKAAYLLNFLKFVRWPPSAKPAAVIPICILGRDPFGPVLDSIVAGQQIDGKDVIVRRLAKPAEVDGCRILFISSSESGGLSTILAPLEESGGVLTVSDIPDFISRGGMIQFVLKADRVRFEVNLKNVERCGLMMSSQMLNVALTVWR